MLVIIFVEVSHLHYGAIFFHAVVLLDICYVTIYAILDLPCELRAEVLGDHGQAARLGKRVQSFAPITDRLWFVNLISLPEFHAATDVGKLGVRDSIAIAYHIEAIVALSKESHLDLIWVLVKAILKELGDPKPKYPVNSNAFEVRFYQLSAKFAFLLRSLLSLALRIIIDHASNLLLLLIEDLHGGLDSFLGVMLPLRAILVQSHLGMSRLVVLVS